MWLVRCQCSCIAVQISELEEDIADMTAIFHDQLEEAMAQLAAARTPLAQHKDSSDQQKQFKDVVNDPSSPTQEQATVQEE